MRHRLIITLVLVLAACARVAPGMSDVSDVSVHPDCRCGPCGTREFSVRSLHFGATPALRVDRGRIVVRVEEGWRVGVPLDSVIVRLDTTGNEGTVQSLRGLTDARGIVEFDLPAEANVYVGAIKFGFEPVGGRVRVRAGHVDSIVVRMRAMQNGHNCHPPLGQAP